MKITWKVFCIDDLKSNENQKETPLFQPPKWQMFGFENVLSILNKIR